VRRVIEWLLSDQQRGQIQQALADHGQPAAAEVLAEISVAKNRLLSPDSYQQQARHTAAPLITAVWRELEVELERSNAWDFDGLLTFAVRLLAEHSHRLAFYRQRWKWLLVDEFQDTNEAQGTLVALLAGPAGNVCCVGDDDQVVYSFRAAEPRNMLCFAERFPGHDTIVLGRNFRSRSEILEPAARCIAHNERRLAKALIATRGAGGEVRVVAYGSDRHEADSVAAAIAQALAQGVAAGEVLVLARTGYATGAVQAALARAGIPHRVLGSLGLYERSEGPRRARLPDAARQPRRRPGIPPRRRLPQTRRRQRNRQPRRRARPRHTPGRPDRRERARDGDREHPAARGARATPTVRRRTRTRPR
jgi:DNA helicase-2/ATP-dependent DNA helicase PcrA